MKRSIIASLMIGILTIGMMSGCGKNEENESASVNQSTGIVNDNAGELKNDTDSIEEIIEIKPAKDNGYTVVGKKYNSNEELIETLRTEYNEAGLKIKEEFLVDDTVVITYVSKYDNKNNLVEYKVISEEGGERSWVYEYDDMGVVTLRRAYDEENRLYETASFSYEYDKDGRIETEIKSIESDCADETLQMRTAFAYDKAGNIAAKENESGLTTYYQYDENNNLTGEFSVNIWNSENNLNCIYYYNEEKQCVRKDICNKDNEVVNYFLYEIER